MQTTPYGNFSDDGSEFVLTEPLLTRPWMNVLTNGAWCYVSSHLGGGYSFLGNPTVSRITRWHIDGIPRDTVGKFLFVRDEESGAWWCANGYPPTRPLDDWKCRIGLGYNTIESRQDGIASSIRYFTPMPPAEADDGELVGDPCLIMQVTLNNASGRPRRLSTTSYAEFALGNWYEDTAWREFYLLFNRQEEKDGVLYLRCEQWIKYIGGWQATNSAANNIPFDKAVFLASSAPVAEFEGDRERFIGPYRDLKDPIALDRALSGKLADGRDACAATRSFFDLADGEEVRFTILLGAVPREAEDASELCERYLDPAKADAAFTNNQAYWGKVTGSPTITTPDGDLDRLVNQWFKYQGSILSWWNRNPGYCYFGIYNFGVRDACQDAASRLPQSPQWVRDHIVKRIMIWQFDDGDYAHGGNFVSMAGTRTFHSDDPINPLFILAKYVRETGDFSILDEKTPWVDPETGISGRSKKPDAAIYEHIISGMEFFWSQFSERGLPLILKADWNDALDQVGNDRKGDSVMLACWAIYCLEQFYPCMEQQGDHQRLADYRARVARLRETVNAIGWDGEWYQRAMHDDGTILGSKANWEDLSGGMIWANPNSFAIIAGVADEERTKRILASFDRYLDHELGSYTFYPPFARPEPRAGVISRFHPGTKENGAIFGHSSRWRMWAECHAGRGDKAYEILKKMSPTFRHQQDPDTYRIEPYAACQFIYGPESDNEGEGSHSWATGTAAWTLIVVWEGLFGLKPELDGLHIDPCLPSDWESATITRSWRGADYEIAITKPKGVQKGTVTVVLDGETLERPVIPAQGDGATHKVEVSIA